MTKIIFLLFLPFLAIGQTQIGVNINGLLAGDNSGNSTVISANGDTVAIGSNLNDNNGIDSGCLRIYKNIGGTWFQQGSDINGAAAGNQFGWSVSLSADGNIVAVGAPKNMSNGTNSGLVRVYKNTSGSWIQQGNDIYGQQAGEQSGWSISLSSDGSIVAIGAPYNTNNGNDSGLVRVYKNTNNVWTQQGTDINSGWYYDNSGRSVALSADGTTVAIGAPYNSLNGAYAGLVKIYKNIAGVWTQEGTDIKGDMANGISGYSVSLSADGTVVAIGAIGNSSNGNNTGYVKIFKNIMGVWTQEGITINGVALNNAFGKSVSLSADGTILAIGADYNSDNGLESGDARIFKNISGVWTPLGNTIIGAAAGDHCGYSISLASDGKTVAIGAPYNATNGVNSGQVRVYDLTSLLASDGFVLANFTVFPNPVSDFLNVNLNQGLELQTLNVYNEMGQFVKKSANTTINITDLAKGTYFVEVITDKGKATKSIIIK